MNELTISKTLKDLGITPRLRGYDYLKEAIELTMDDKSLVHKLTKVLYPEVAKQFGSTSSRVERSMRFAIESAWTYTDSDIRDEVFRCTIDIHRGKPTNGQFIATVTDYLIEISDGGAK